MKYATSIALAAGLASAAPTADFKLPSTSGFNGAVVLPSRGGRAVCVSGTFPVKASTDKNLKFNFQIPQNQTVTTQTFLSLIGDGSPFARQIITGTQKVSGTYQIAGSLCAPANSTPTSVQVLTHGVGFDRFYWDFAPGYSYVDAAADAGYATFLYDRLGVGLSERPDPLNVVQGPLQVEIVNTIVQELRKGTFGGRSFKSVVGVGHSYGSLITEALTSQYPKTLDGAVLTGFTNNQTGTKPFVTGLNIAIASQSMQAARFPGLNPGYLIGNGPSSNQIAFFRFPGFDPKIANEAALQSQTTTYGELFTQTILATTAEDFTGPVVIANGLEDLPFCFANCTYPVDKSRQSLTQLYPKAKGTSTTLNAENAGHGLNLHYAALAVFRTIQQFIKSNNL